MVEINVNCEEGCFFNSLSLYEKRINRETREDALNGKQPSGPGGEMCWDCIKRKERDDALEQERLNFPQRLLKLKTFLCQNGHE